MRVLIAGSFPDVPGQPQTGIEAVVWQLTRHLAALPDTDVHVATARKGAVAGVTRVDGVTVHRADLPHRLPDLVAEAYAEAAFVRKVADEIDADLVNGFGTGGASIGAVTSGRPHLVSPRGLPRPPARRPGMTLLSPSWLREAARAKVANYPLRHADHIAAASPNVREAIAAMSGARIYQFAAVVAPEFFDLVHEPRAGTPPTLLAVGAIEPRKHLDLVIRALAVLRRDVPDARLRIAGHLPVSGVAHRDELRSLAERLGVGDAVRFIGGLSHERLLREYAEADVLVHAGEEETWPLAITQAFSAGLPVAALESSGVRELVESGVTGVLAHPATPRGLASAVHRLLEQPDEAFALAATARARARRDFDPHQVALETRGLFAQIIAEGVGGGH